jgi:hypothetical protein
MGVFTILDNKLLLLLLIMVSFDASTRPKKNYDIYDHNYIIDLSLYINMPLPLLKFSLLFP